MSTSISTSESPQANTGRYFLYNKFEEHRNYKKALEILSDHECYRYAEKARNCLAKYMFFLTIEIGQFHSEKSSSVVDGFWRMIDKRRHHDEIELEKVYLSQSEEENSPKIPTFGSSNEDAFLTRLDSSSEYTPTTRLGSSSEYIPSDGSEEDDEFEVILVGRKKLKKTNELSSSPSLPLPGLRGRATKFRDNGGIDLQEKDKPATSCKYSLRKRQHVDYNE
ncbi:3490_t:CDS:2, partial [Funneliformis mosseae]